MVPISGFGFLYSNCKTVLLFSLKPFSFQRNSRILLTNLQFAQSVPYLQQHYQSTGVNGESNERKAVSSAEVSTSNKLSQRARLKLAVRDYGATIIVFHVTISLASLGLCYLAVSNGLDAVSLLTRIGFPESVISNKIAVGGSTFVVSYAVHKLFAPARIGITLSAAPFIVRYLRKIKLIKPPK